jgi:hypothetical protein
MGTWWSLGLMCEVLEKQKILAVVGQ